ncbi:MAG: hypothetical protein ABIJ23_03640 [Candidatus Magasanikbacteria bacterium]
MKREFILIGILGLMLGIVGMVMAAQDTKPTSATVSINEFLSVTIDDATITFGALNPSDTDKKPSNDPLNATIGSETNVGSINVKTKANAANFNATTGTFAVNNLEWDIATGAFPGTAYTISDATVCTGLIASGSCSIYHELDIPAAQTAGAYSVGITITATTA